MSYFVNPRGQLCYESRTFFKCSSLVDGVEETPLWRDAFALNLAAGEVVVEYQDWPFDVPRGYEGHMGFRLDFNWTTMLVIKKN